MSTLWQVYGLKFTDLEAAASYLTVLTQTQWTPRTNEHSGDYYSYRVSLEIHMSMQYNAMPDEEGEDPGWWEPDFQNFPLLLYVSVELPMTVNSTSIMNVVRSNLILLKESANG